MKHIALLILIIPTLLTGQECEKTYNKGYGSSIQQTMDDNYISLNL